MPAKSASSGAFTVSKTGTLNRPLSKKERLVRRKAEKAAKRRKTAEEQRHREDPGPSKKPPAATRTEEELHQREAHVPSEVHPISDSKEEDGGATPVEGKTVKNPSLKKSLNKHPVPDRSDAESLRDATGDDDEGDATSNGDYASDNEDADVLEEDDADKKAEKAVDGHHVKKPTSAKAKDFGKSLSYDLPSLSFTSRI